MHLQPVHLVNIVLAQLVEIFIDPQPDELTNTSQFFGTEGDGDDNTGGDDSKQPTESTSSTTDQVDETLSAGLQALKV